MLSLFLSPSAPIRVTHDYVTVLLAFKTGVKVQGQVVLVMADIDGEAVERQTNLRDARQSDRQTERIQSSIVALFMNSHFSPWKEKDK